MVTVVTQAEVTFWKNGDTNRKVAVYGPCACGCSPYWYLSGSGPDGEGVTVQFPDEVTARRFAATLNLPVIA